MDKKIIAFRDTEIEKHKFHCHKNPILIDDAYVNKITLSNKISFGKECCEYFIGYKANEKIKPLRIMLPKMSGYRKEFNGTEYLSF